MPSGKDFLSSRPKNVHSILDRILLKNGRRVKHFKYTGNCSPVYFNGINLLVLHVKVNKVFCQCDIGKVSGWNAFVIGPLDKGFPLGIVDVIRRVT